MYEWERWHPIQVLPADLIAFAWSAPMRELATKVGISDVGLRKLLRGKGVVLPPQGHWNRVHAGRKVEAPPKPPARRPGETGRVSVDRRLSAYVSEAKPMPSSGPFASAEVPEDLDELREQELKKIGRVSVARTLDLAHPALVRLLKKEGERAEKTAASKWVSYWDEPRFSSPMWLRQLRLINATFLALQKRGHGGQLGDADWEIHPHALIGDMRVGFSIQTLKPTKTVMRDAQRVFDPDIPATTPLKLQIADEGGGRQTVWQDGSDAKLESQVAEIAAALIVAGEAQFRSMLKKNEEYAERVRIEREAREERERIEREEKRQAKLRALNEQRIADLRRSGELLRLAADVRLLIAQVKSAVADRADVSAADLAAWEAWASDQVDQIDPIRSGQFMSHMFPPQLDPEPEP